MTIEIETTNATINKVEAGELKELNYPWVNHYVLLFCEVENNEATKPKTIKKLKLKSKTKELLVDVKGVYLDTFINFIPKGFKKGDHGITVELNHI
jgi:hypothetical protein